MWVLNIDDDRDDREIFCDALKEINPTIKCIGKDNAEEAINLLNSSSLLPNYIFLDINMPKMGGIECLKKIKKNDRLSEIPVIVLSTTVSRKEIDEVKRLGADFLSKEPSFVKYVNSLKTKLDGNRESGFML
jgi:CheY-like chemotaxis protein